MANAFQLRYEHGRLYRQFQVSNAYASWASDVTFEAGSLVATVGWDTVGRSILRLANFGFKMRHGVFPMTSHRSESINLDTPSQTFREGRCLVPVDVFYEQGLGPDGDIVRSSYGSYDGSMLGLAALIRPEGAGLSVTILTIPAGVTVGSANGRMPAIVGEDDYDLWLDDTTHAKAAINLIRLPRDDLLVERPF